VRRALVRAVPDSFGAALTMAAKPRPLDPERARAQHAAYVAALRGLGVAVRALPADEACPDCCFIEDTAVVAGDTALLTRPGAASRRGEGEAVAAALADTHRVVRMSGPATLDGGDVLRSGDTLWVGRSGRTDAGGHFAVSLAFPGLRVVPVDVPGALHLQCVATALGPDAVLLAEGTVDPAVFAGREVVLIPQEEAYAANVVALGGAVLVAAGYPATARALAARGLAVVALDMSEFAAADGSLTCLSLRW